MIKTRLFFSAVILNCITLFSVVAQNSEETIEIKLRSPSAIFSATDSLGNYVFVFQSSTQLQFSFFNSFNKSNGNIVISTPSDSRKDEVLDAQIEGDICVLYLHNNKKLTVSAIIVNRATGQNRFVNLGQFNYSDKYLKSFLLNGSFYLLTVPQGRNQIDVWLVTERGLEKTSYLIEMTDFYKRLVANNTSLNDATNSAVGIDKINYDLENNVKSAQSSKKIYGYQDKIFLTFDDPENTHFIQIDLTNKTVQYRQLQFGLDKSLNAFKKQGNSFLYKDILFRSTMNMDQLNVSVIKLDSLVLLANYNAYPHTKIMFKNGPILQEGSSDKQKIIDDNNMYFRKVLNGTLSIAATKKDSMYIIEVGGYEKITNNNGYGPGGFGGPSISMGMGMGGMGMGMGGMGMGGMGGGYGMGMPGYYNGYSGYYPYNSSYSSIRTIYFHSLVNSSTYEHETGIVPITLRERVSNFENAMFKDKIPSLIRIVDFQNAIIIGFVIPNRNVFKTYSFEK